MLGQPAGQSGVGPPVSAYSGCVSESLRPPATLVIPQAWLHPGVTLDAVRALQRSDTESLFERGDLHLRGVEVLVARNWIRDEFWPRIQDSLQQGYTAEKTYTYLRAHGERRRLMRPAPS